MICPKWIEDGRAPSDVVNIPQRYSSYKSVPIMIFRITQQPASIVSVAL